MVRCVKCGAPIDGFAQFCDKCAAEKHATEEAAKTAVSTSTMTCPWCSASMSRAAQRCPSCMRDWADYQRPITSMGRVQRADFWIRLVATLCDGFLLIVPLALARMLVGPVIGWPVALVVSLAYNIGFWTNTGATPGKMLLGLRVVDMNGHTIGLSRAAVRWIVLMLENLFWLLYLVILGEEKLGLHDRAAGTQVVYARTLPQQTPSVELHPVS
jgi:uncharacterized RDD family membrane protein YckC